MEKWQKNHLTTHRAKLVEETMCNELIFSHLLAQRVLANVDVERIKRKTDRYEQAAALYATLETRTNGYVKMAEALAKVNQTGPFGVFLEGFAEHVIPDINVVFLGNTLHLSDVFDGQEMKRILNETKHHLTLEKCVSLYDKAKKAHEPPIKLIRDTIPEQISFYVPRSLSKRVNVDPEVYKLKCSDVFVFKGMSWSELKKLVHPEGVENSATQLLSLSTRFIILDQIEDWEELCKIARVPVHLIKYEKENGEQHILEATTGGSIAIHQFLKFQQTLEGENESVSISEDTFFEEVSREGTLGVCICDLPGMGKSLLLANLARKMNQEHPDRVVVFIQLSQFMAFVVAKKEKQVIFQPDEAVVKKMLLEYITQSSLEYFLLTELLEKIVTRLELFFDGFDEIQLGHVEVAKQMLTSASRLPNTRIFVTSRPNMRHELEACLHVISYDILPFSNANQIEFLSTFWNNLKPTCEKVELQEFAEFCIKNLKKSLQDEEENITGIPLQCRLVGEVFTQNAIVFAHPNRNASAEGLCKIDSSLADLYTRYFDLRFSKLGTRFNPTVSTKLILSGAAGQATRLVEAVVGGNACLSETHEVKRFHMLQALKLLFPENSEGFSQLFMEATTTSQLSSVLSVGILQRQLTEVGQESFQFMHRTFAEYLAAELFANLLYDEKGDKTLRNELLQFMFQAVMMTVEYGYVPNFCHHVVVHFLNAACADKLISPNDNVLFDAFSASAINIGLFSILKTIIRYNFLNLLILLKQLICKMSFFSFQYVKRYTFKTSTPRLSELLSTAASNGDMSLVEQVFQLLHECFHIDLKDRDKKLFVVIGSYNENPLKKAILSRNYEVAEFFAERMKTEDIITILVRKSVFDAPMHLERKIRILSILLERNKNLAEDEPLVLAEPCGVHLDIIKLLLRKGGVDPRAAYKMKTLVHRAAEEMSGSDFTDLCQILIKDFGAIDLFEEVEGKWMCPLPEILANGRISEHTIKTIYDLPWLDEIGSDAVEMEAWPYHRQIRVDVNYSSKEGETLLMKAIRGRRSMESIRRMIEKGADVWVQANESGYSFVHFFSLGNYSPEEYDELVQMLVNMQMGKLFQVTDIAGETPLHKAILHVELCPKTINLLMCHNRFVDVNAVNKLEESFLYKTVFGKRQLDLVKYLVEMGADWSFKTKDGCNLAHISASKGLLDHLKYFVELGCDINEVDQYGDNTLQCAVSKYANTTMEVIQFLIESGAQKEKKNVNGETAYEMAINSRVKDVRILKLLK